MEFFWASTIHLYLLSSFADLIGTGYAFKDIQDIKLYPSVGMKKPHAHVDVNFGQKPFSFDIDGHVNVSAFLPTCCYNSG